MIKPTAAELIVETARKFMKGKRVVSPPRVFVSRELFKELIAEYPEFKFANELKLNGISIEIIERDVPIAVFHTDSWAEIVKD